MTATDRAADSGSRADDVAPDEVTGRASTPAADRSSFRVWILAACLGLLAVAGATPLVHLDALPDGFDVAWWQLLVAFVVAELLVFHLTFGKHSVTFTLSELPITVSLVALAPPVAIGVRIGGSIIGLLVQRVRGVKLVFNVLSASLEIVAAIAVYRAVLGGADPLDSRGWLAALTALLAVDLISGATINAAISLHEGRFDRSAAPEIVATGIIAATTNTCLAIVTLIVLERDPRAAIALAVVGAVLLASYRAWAHQTRRFGHLETLYEFAQALDALGEDQPADVAHDGDLHDRDDGDDGATRHDLLAHLALQHARQLTGASHAELVLERDGQETRWVVEDGDDSPTRVPRADEPWWPGIDRPLLASHKPNADASAFLCRLGRKDAIAVPIRTSRGAHGHLLVADRSDDVTTFQPADLTLLEALSNQIGAELDNVALVDRLRVEVAEKAHLAMHDALTGLPNRRMFTSEMQLALSDPKRSVAVLLMDLDRFKEINDTLGHSAGDSVLGAVARRLHDAIGEMGLIARIGGDEFAVLLVDLDADHVAVIAADVLHVLQQPVIVDDLVVDLAASMGGAIAPLHGTAADVLMQRADVAMYVAKDRQAGFEMYSFERDVNDVRRLHLVAELRSAISARALTVLYQPQIDATTQELSGVEALVRWTSTQYGPVGPDEFIPIAECTGLIDPLTDLVIDTALHDIAAWTELGWRGSMSVNLSTRSLADIGLVDNVRTRLAASGVDASSLTLEVTESSIMRDVERNVEVLKGLSDLGIRVSIDDFGTGYSSLAYLKRLPVSELKIDRSFTANIEWDDSDRTIVRATIRLAHDLGLDVVAEGVETSAAYDLLRSWGVDTAQGYHFGRPMPASDITRRITERPRKVLSAC